jgi:hypothetical protein
MSNIDRLAKVVEQLDGTDKVFRLVVYSLRIIHALYAQKYGDKEAAALRMARLMSSVGDARVVMRLTGLIPMVQWASGVKNLFDKPINTADLLLKVKLLSMFVYYPAEHLYFFGSHEILPVTKADVWSRISCRAWAIYVMADLISLKISYDELQVAIDTKNGEKDELKRLKRQRRDLLIRVVNSCSDLVLATHWSLESYPLPNVLVGVFGLLSAVCSFSTKWKNTTI